MISPHLEANLIMEEGGISNKTTSSKSNIKMKGEQ
jgi:hypothetical protein